MAFFLGIGGPWIVLMILDLFWTKQSLEHSPPPEGGGWQQRLEYLLQSREKVPSPIRARGLQRRRESGEDVPSGHSSL